MRILIVADVHANLAALDAVIADAGTVDAVWCLGDVVGYGPQPVECIDRLREFDLVAIAGNHDLAAAGAVGVEMFNPLAREAALWTKQTLPESYLDYLRTLPPSTVVGDFTLVHGSLKDPVWDYLVSSDAARTHFRGQSTRYSLVGHSHLPLGFADDALDDGSAIADGDRLPLGEDRWVANPGSVGQPRDGDPRAAYAVLDDEVGVLTFHRVAYHIELTQALMREAGLPQPLVDRLARGR